ncbi:MAG: YfiR family protein [Prolixibacteraceae bacterium]|jgi:hypothetical protein|nr:YfiR family protein [Prolixibacteraceae bacterium]
MKKQLSTRILLALIFLTTGMICGNNSFAQSREYLLKAGFLEKFTHFIEWPGLKPDNAPSETFKIAVIGENKFDHALEEIFEKTKVKNKVPEIIYISSVSEIKDCMMLFIAGKMDHKLDDILLYTTGKPILTISENSGYGRRGTIINMVLVNDYIRYEINRNALEKSGLKMSSLLLESAIITKDE